MHVCIASTPDHGNPPLPSSSAGDGLATLPVSLPCSLSDITFHKADRIYLLWIFFVLDWIGLDCSLVGSALLFGFHLLLFSEG
jgi:hypothetical protein